MAALERFSTSGLRPRQRVEAWNELCCAFTPVAAQPLDLSTFEPSCTRGAAGGLRLSEVCSSASTVEHTSAHVAKTSESLYFLFVQIEGTSVHRQGGREAHLQPGDFTLLGTSRPYQMVFDGPNQMLALALTEPLLQRQIPCPQSVVAVRMGYQDNLARMLSDFTAGLWRECAGLGLNGAGAALAGALSHLIAGAYSRLAPGDGSASLSLENRRFQILGFIEDHLRDSDLSPATIAARFKTSPRSLHMLFSNSAQTLSRYILRRRLEESARALTSPLQQARTISDIAFDHGFCSSAHFCKVFRDHFDETPTEYRGFR